MVKNLVMNQFSSLKGYLKTPWTPSPPMTQAPMYALAMTRAMVAGRTSCAPAPPPTTAQAGVALNLTTLKYAIPWTEIAPPTVSLLATATMVATCTATDASIATTPSPAFPPSQASASTNPPTPLMTLSKGQEK